MKTQGIQNRKYLNLLKVAGVGDREGVLIPLLPEPDDSGIDSDGTELARALQGEEPVQLTETSSSDEDPQPIVKPPWGRCVRKKPDDELTNMEDGPLENGVFIPMVQWQTQNGDINNYEPNSDRSSPPLYEVELTASDEEDDASVLELVIPLQSDKHKRVPKSTPKEILEFLTFFCTFFCCFR